MSEWNVGDVARLRAEVRDPTTGALTNATSTAWSATSPTGVTSAPASVNDGTGLYHGDLPLPAAGVWRYTFTSTSPTTVEEGVLVVVAQGSRPPWTPQTRDVAAFVPGRTDPLGDVAPGYVADFSVDSTPTAEQVERLVAGAAAYVAARAGTVDPALYELARETVAARAAGYVEIAYPPTAGGPDVGGRWLGESETLLQALVRRNAELTGVVLTPGGATAPRWSFPKITEV